MAENKTKPTDASVAEYVASRANEQQRADSRALMGMFKRLTRSKPRMWGPSIVGYGVHPYVADSGRTGKAPLAAFAIRGREFVVYLAPEVAAQRARLAKLGKHKVTKCCLYFKQLADLDRSLLEALVVDSMPNRQMHRPR